LEIEIVGRSQSKLASLFDRSSRVRSKVSRRGFSRERRTMFPFAVTRRACYPATTSTDDPVLNIWRFYRPTKLEIARTRHVYVRLAITMEHESQRRSRQDGAAPRLPFSYRTLQLDNLNVRAVALVRILLDRYRCGERSFPVQKLS